MPAHVRRKAVSPERNLSKDAEMGVVQQAGPPTSSNARCQSRPKRLFVQEGYIAASKTGASKQGKGILWDGWTSSMKVALATTTKRREDVLGAAVRTSVLRSLRWLARRLGARNIVLRAGQRAARSAAIPHRKRGVRGASRKDKLTMWFTIATNKSKNSLPPASISACMVPLRLNVCRLRTISAR